ncbi:MAG: DUF2188 domain-containing protein [Thermoleophilaceae bacterium]|nr:DUF2188 domain-containing protein [Thermoleophilaceae bacterium]
MKKRSNGWEVVREGDRRATAQTKTKSDAIQRPGPSRGRRAAATRCGRAATPDAIRALLDEGYPPERILYSAAGSGTG